MYHPARNLLTTTNSPERKENKNKNKLPRPVPTLPLLCQHKSHLSLTHRIASISANNMTRHHSLTSSKQTPPLPSLPLFLSLLNLYHHDFRPKVLSTATSESALQWYYRKPNSQQNALIIARILSVSRDLKLRLRRSCERAPRSSSPSPTQPASQPRSSQLAPSHRVHDPRRLFPIRTPGLESPHDQGLLSIRQLLFPPSGELN